ncbi:MAG TPA: toprim domain-containing protein [Polyangia bacterium]|nr:toprim domain-containing protein [Polyangia bacterium]
MTAQEIVNRLERVAKSHDGWTARCPAHEDDRPSLSIGIGEDGRVLLRCFAGCQLDAILSALQIEVSDLFQREPAPVGRARGTPLPALEVFAAAEWLKNARALPAAEAARMFAAETRGGPAVVFRYVGEDGAVLYDKFRPIGDRKVFWRVPRGRSSALYGLGDLDKSGGERVVVVEGELDFHALRAVGIGPVVSVPDGAGSRLSPELLRPLEGFRRILIATDADGPGDELAARLGRELGPQRCRRVRLVDGLNTLKDANDALRAGWTRERFEAVLATATPATRGPTTGGDPPAVGDDEPVLLAGAGDESSPYRVLDGHLCRMRHDRDGNETTQVLANFDARIFEEVAYDDGAEVVRAFKVSGRLANGTALPDARVNASEFGGLNWVPSAWGARALVTAGQGAKDHLRAAIQVLSDPVSRLVFRHTGWREHRGNWIYLYQGGGVGTDDITVELDPPLDRFVLPPATVDLPDAVTWSLRMLDAAPASVAIPLLAATYAAPLAFIVNPDFALWLVGPTGSLKSELAALAQRHFGAFDRKTLPGSWTSTENALEARLFTVKDAVAVIDDYAPNADSRAQQELEKRAQRVIRGIGNRASRGRLRADLSQQPDRPPRGMVVCTGEDLPSGHSIQARLVIVEVDRDRLNMPVITDLQANGPRFAHAMRGYIEWLQPSIPMLRKAAPDRVGAIRNELHRVGSHLRQADALAHLRFAFELFLEFAEEVGAVDAARANDFRGQARETLRAIGEEQGSNLKELEPAERFIAVLGTLLEQKRVRLVERGTVPREDVIEAIGWFDEEYAYLLPDAARRRVATFMRESGEAWGHSTHALHKALVRKGFAVAGFDGRPEVQVRVGDGRRRVLRIRLSVLRGSGGPGSGPGPAPVLFETGAGSDDEILME